MSDIYTKIILTIIALALSVISIKQLSPVNADAALFSGGPTVGDIRKLRELPEGERKEKYQALMDSIPLIRVHGAVNIQGNVDCN